MVRPSVTEAKEGIPDEAIYVNSIEPAAIAGAERFEMQPPAWLISAKEWLFGGNLVAKAGLLARAGITQEALALADQDIIIPMIGMVQSLNVSVASALILYEAQRQRQNAGMYLRENSMLPEAEQQRLLFEGGYPVLAKVAKRKGLPYPHVNQQGEIEADADWWSTMQAAG